MKVCCKVPTSYIKLHEAQGIQVGDILEGGGVIVLEAASCVDEWPKIGRTAVTEFLN